MVLLATLSGMAFASLFDLAGTVLLLNVTPSLLFYRPLQNELKVKDTKLDDSNLSGGVNSKYNDK